MQIAGRRYTIMGLGRHGGGVAAARWLAERCARVTVTDLAEPAALADSIARLADVPIAGWTLGRHEAADFLAADVVVVNPAVRPGHPLLELAQAQGVRLTSEIELFLAHCPAAVVAVTGSNGKSTTASLLAEIFAAAGQPVWLGGNIGTSLLPSLADIRPADRVVLELSSFQIAWLDEGACWPRAAAVTNCTANHLDWHGSWAAYASAKRRLVEHLPADGIGVMNLADPEVGRWRAGLEGTILSPWPEDRVPPLRIVGSHNRLNAACAGAMAEALGVPLAAIELGLSRFPGLAHRCRAVAEVAGRRFVDDSKSTTPEATQAALTACPGRAWVLLGGQDKGGDFRPLIAALADRGCGVASFGSAGPALAKLIRELAPALSVAAFADLPAALAWCWERSQAGDTILLSPACASHDQFLDFEHRAAVFVQRVEALRTAHPE